MAVVVNDNNNKKKKPINDDNNNNYEKQEKLDVVDDDNINNKTRQTDCIKRQRLPDDVQYDVFNKAHAATMMTIQSCHPHKKIRLSHCQIKFAIESRMQRNQCEEKKEKTR